MRGSPWCKDVKMGIIGSQHALSLNYAMLDSWWLTSEGPSHRRITHRISLSPMMGPSTFHPSSITNILRAESLTDCNSWTPSKLQQHGQRQYISQLRERKSRPFTSLLSALALLVFIGVMWRCQMVLDVNSGPFHLWPIKMKSAPLQCFQFLKSKAICMQSFFSCVLRHWLVQGEHPEGLIWTMRELTTQTWSSIPCGVEHPKYQRAGLSSAR